RAARLRWTDPPGQSSDGGRGCHQRSVRRCEGGLMMASFTTLESLAVPIARANVDTDAIIPKQFMKSIRRTGFGENLFDEWRYMDHGEPGQDPASRRPNPDFVLNQPRYKGASVLLARKNFGCGSSREHAPWALQ